MLLPARAELEPDLTGVVIESCLSDGRQELTAEPLRRDVSVTDACLGRARTKPLLDALTEASRHRRRTAAVARPSEATALHH
ncbi:hypothetical protein [Streptomyces sp. NPDC047973]|uniref:hypothetical protein n=1 Tax=Streptomyces sp. NPDC047973 TaxID=3155383 RepID=UPI0034486807